MVSTILKRAILSFLFAIIASLSFFTGYAQAERRYITDFLRVTLREGPGTDYAVIRTLNSNTPVDVFEEEDRYLKVRTESGVVGWVPKQYITSKIPKPKIIEGLKEEIEQLKDTMSILEKGKEPLLEELQTAKEQHATALNELEQIVKDLREEATNKSKALDEVTKKYEGLLEKSKDVVDLISEHEKFQNENAKLTKEVSELRDENEQLRRTGTIRWFLAGAGVFFVGLLAGKINRKKRYY